MAHLIDKDALVAEIERLFEKAGNSLGEYRNGAEHTLISIKDFLDTLEVKEVIESKLPNPRFPHLDNIVDKVFGTANLESFEYEEAEQLVLLAKEELLKDLEVKDFWKSADGDDLPEIDREVVALLGNGKVGFAHRPPEYWDGKNIITGKVTRNYPKTYDKGGWNIPNIKYWLDVELPKEIEL